AAVLFLVYLNRNGLLYTASGQKRLADSGLVALTLLIAESKPAEKNDIVKIVVNLINKNNK
ncbi:MAG: death-on-curing protein, partial [bacterium]|nr:death-on-curing protein [bacterium]